MTRQQIIARFLEIAALLRAMAERVGDESLERECLQAAGDAAQDAVNAGTELMELEW